GEKAWRWGVGERIAGPGQRSKWVAGPREGRLPGTSGRAGGLLLPRRTIPTWAAPDRGRITPADGRAAHGPSVYNTARRPGICAGRSTSGDDVGPRCMMCRPMIAMSIVLVASAVSLPRDAGCQERRPANRGWIVGTWRSYKLDYGDFGEWKGAAHIELVASSP